MNDDQLFKGPDGTTALRFFSVPSINSFQSERTGKQVYDTSLMVEIMVPGMRESAPQIELERVFCEEYGLDANGQRQVLRSERYAEFEAQIEAYKKQTGAGIVDGFPLSEWPQIDAGTCATLKAAGVFTVEQLSQINDGNLPHLGIGGSRLRDMARQYLQTRQFGLPSAAMSGELSQAKARIVELEAQLAAANAALANAAATQPVAAPAVLADIPPAPVSAPTGDVFGIDTPNTLVDGIDGLGTPPSPPLPAVDPFAPPPPPLGEQTMFTPPPAPASEPLI